MNYFERCQKCPPDERHPGCQDHCKHYAESKAKYEADKDKYNKKCPLKYYINEHNAAVKDGIAKYNARRKRCDR